MEETVRDRRSRDPLGAIHDARRRLLAAGTARLSLRRDPDVEAPEVRSRGVLARIGRMLTGHGNPWEAEGILDLAHARSACDYGQFAVTEIGDGIWGGPSGRSLASMPADPDCRPGPLWFLGAVEFLNAADDDGPEGVRDTSCRRLHVRADLSVSPEVRSVETSGAMHWLPELVPDLTAVPLTVWIDDEHLRRVRLPIGRHVQTLELWDIGVDIAGFDWTRLSTFRTSVAEDARARVNLV